MSRTTSREIHQNSATQHKLIHVSHVPNPQRRTGQWISFVENLSQEVLCVDYDLTQQVDFEIYF